MRTQRGRMFANFSFWEKYAFWKDRVSTCMYVCWIYLLVYMSPLLRQSLTESKASLTLVSPIYLSTRLQSAWLTGMHVQTHWAFYIGNGDSYSGPVLIDQAILLLVHLQSPISRLEIYGLRISWSKIIKCFIYGIKNYKSPGTMALGSSQVGCPRRRTLGLRKTGDSIAAEHAVSEDIWIAPLTFHTAHNGNDIGAFIDFLIMRDHFPYYQRDNTFLVLTNSWCYF